MLRGHDAVLRDAAAALRKRPEEIAEAIVELRDQREAAAKAAAAPANGAVDVGPLVARATEIGGATVLAEVLEVADAQALLGLADRAKGKLGDAAILLGTAVGGRVHLVASVAPSLVERGVRPARSSRRRPQVIGGGGGGRDTMAQAGGREPDDCRRPSTPAARRSPPCWARRAPMRVLALDYGSARCGCALSDATGTLATPIEAIERPATRKGLARSPELVRQREVDRIVVGLPTTLAGATATRRVRRGVRRRSSGARRDGARGDVRRALHDRDRIAQRRRRASEDSRAAAVMLQDWLARYDGGAGA